MTEKQELRKWFEDTLKLPQYFDLCYNAGYEDLSYFDNDVTEDDLIDVGITKRPHIKKILKEIKKLMGQSNSESQQTSGFVTQSIGFTDVFSDAQNNEYDQKENNNWEPDEVYTWCTKHGFQNYYSKLVNDFGITSVQEIIQAPIDDLIDVCGALYFSNDEQQIFLNAVISCKEDNEFKLWCQQNNMHKFYDPLIERGYFSCRQISKLSKDERSNLYNEVGIKFGHKQRFENNLPGLIDVKSRKLIQVSSNKDDADVKVNRTILFVGETGTGKTTTINSMMNYLYCATFEGNRYQLIEEKCADKLDTESQTDKISVYRLSPPAIDYALTIVDTPGFGNCDKKGIQFDQIITTQLESLFKTEVTEINGICFVVKSNQTRLTQRQQYVFREIIDVFGENVANNIILLFTFDDGSEVPLGLAAVNNNTPKIPHKKNYFTFNNNGFGFVQNLDEKKRNNFNRGLETFGDFFEEIANTKTESLQLSKQVLQQRNTLKYAVKRAEKRLRDGLNIYKAIINRIKRIEENKDKINEDDETLLTIQVPESRKVIVKDTRLWTRWFSSKTENDHQHKNQMSNVESKDALRSFWVCENCKLTCEHFRFTGYFCGGCDEWTDDDEFISNDCIKKVKYRYQLVLKELTVPVKQLQSGYLDASLHQKRSDLLIEKESKKLQQAEHDLCQLIAKMKKCIDEIKRLALNKCVLKTNDYYNILIREEKKRCDEGWEDRINVLESLQKQYELIENIEKNMESRSIKSIFPEYKTIESFHQEEEKKENERINNMNKKSFVDQKQEKYRPKKREFREEGWWWWKKTVYNLKYGDILRDFRGHIIKTEDQGKLLPVSNARNCCVVSQDIYSDDYKEKKYNDFKIISHEHKSGSFSQCIRWMILVPKNKQHDLYLSFKGTSELLELIVNVAAIPHKIFSNNKSEQIEVHGGMRGALMRDFEEITHELRKWKIGEKDSQIKNVFITGHSLGGGLAILCGYEMIRCGMINQESMKYCSYNVVTFGAPTVLACDINNKTTLKRMIQTDERLKLLNDICHCYINRLDPVPRLIHLLHELPNIMEKIIGDIITENTSRLSALKGFIISSVETPIRELKRALNSLNAGELSSMYFAVGKQYIWCGKHKNCYCGEEIKIRIQSDIVTSFDASKFKNIPLTLWRELLKDHEIKNYQNRLRNKMTII